MDVNEDTMESLPTSEDKSLLSAYLDNLQTVSETREENVCAKLDVWSIDIEFKYISIF